MGKLQDLMRVANVLKAAKDIVASRWVKGDYVQDKQGEGLSNTSYFLGIPPDDNDDWGYCGDGALRRAVKNEINNWNEKPSKVETLLYDAQKALLGPISRRVPVEQMRLNGLKVERTQHKIWCFNDMAETTHEAMLEVYDEAIEAQCALVQKKKAEEQDGSPSTAS